MKQKDVFIMNRKCEESEKWLERHLTALTKQAGGVSLKFSSHTQTGYPDRLLLFPNGVTGWVELKSRGQHPTKLQCLRINELRRLGHKVWVCDTREAVEEAVRILARDAGDLFPMATRRGRSGT